MGYTVFCVAIGGSGNDTFFDCAIPQPANSKPTQVIAIDTIFFIPRFESYIRGHGKNHVSQNAKEFKKWQTREEDRRELVVKLQCLKQKYGDRKDKRLKVCFCRNNAILVFSFSILPTFLQCN